MQTSLRKPNDVTPTEHYERSVQLKKCADWTNGTCNVPTDQEIKTYWLRSHPVSMRDNIKLRGLNQDSDLADLKEALDEANTQYHRNRSNQDRNRGRNQGRGGGPYNSSGSRSGNNQGDSHHEDNSSTSRGQNQGSSIAGTTNQGANQNNMGPPANIYAQDTHAVEPVLVNNWGNADNASVESSLFSRTPRNGSTIIQN